MQDPDEARAADRELVRKKIEAGLNSLAAGNGIDGDAFMDEMDRKLALDVEATERYEAAGN